MTYHTLLEPRPLWHALGEGACRGVAFLIVTEVDAHGIFRVEDLRLPNGYHVRAWGVPTRCPACGGNLDTANYSQMMHDPALRKVDPFRAAMLEAIASQDNPVEGT